jgi:hypothetical protein
MPTTNYDKETDTTSIEDGKGGKIILDGSEIEDLRDLLDGIIDSEDFAIYDDEDETQW